MKVQETAINGDIELAKKSSDGYHRESTSGEAKTQLKWTKADYLWGLLGMIGIVLVVKGAIVVGDARKMMQDPSNFKPSDFGVTTQKELQAKFDAYPWPSIADFWMPLVVAVLFGIIEAGIMSCGIGWARSI